jgi:hypothetical protein
MIFLTEKIRNSDRIEVIVYDTLEQLSESVDWQDILDEAIKILDDSGKIYKWDDTKKNEYGMVFNYSFRVIGIDEELVRKCNNEFIRLGQSETFEIKI